jgi:hypothetical protein
MHDNSRLLSPGLFVGTVYLPKRLRRTRNIFILILQRLDEGRNRPPGLSKHNLLGPWSTTVGAAAAEYERAPHGVLTKATSEYSAPALRRNAAGSE